MALKWGGNFFVIESRALNFPKMGRGKKLNQKDKFASFCLIVIVTPMSNQFFKKKTTLVQLRSGCKEERERIVNI